MPDAEAGSEVLGRVVDALHMTDRGLDGLSIAELLWLALRRRIRGKEGSTALSARRQSQELRCQRNFIAPAE